MLLEDASLPGSWVVASEVGLPKVRRRTSTLLVRAAHMEDKIQQYFFGYSFRGDQQEVVRQILSGNDVAVL